MKKAFVLCVIISMMCSMIAFADETELFFPTYEQTASAYLDQSGKAVKVTVDLTGGWSVEFAPGAVYLYEGNTERYRTIPLSYTESQALLSHHYSLSKKPSESIPAISFTRYRLSMMGHWKSSR